MAFILFWAFTASFLVGFKQINIICTYNIACHSYCQVVIHAIASAELKILSCKYIIHYLILYIDIKVPIYSTLINILLTCCFTSAGFSSFSSTSAATPALQWSNQVVPSNNQKEVRVETSVQPLESGNQWLQRVKFFLCERIRIYKSRLLTCKESHISSSAWCEAQSCFKHFASKKIAKQGKWWQIKHSNNMHLLNTTCKFSCMQCYHSSFVLTCSIYLCFNRIIAHYLVHKFQYIWTCIHIVKLNGHKNKLDLDKSSALAACQSAHVSPFPAAQDVAACATSTQLQEEAGSFWERWLMESDTGRIPSAKH